ncbi:MULTISPECIES: type II toxin-antitoxin system death-on-curing family toxin [Lacticaseibacillus]|uniref:Death-on-curing protein n=2 Tax=Lacticaseibacillus TaxID=2759736 RepID=A0AAN1KF11_LACCA|nr:MULTISPECIES: type II toxin-antitoxin system death-on-curing family toxin [Lacticaseibacillus]ARY92276.1 death-on-curing protein [Lacticaseibacillus casei]KAB1971323.1 type II toxin-antitoxin system death-on-curing family toxin [Lacticaseibacillus casei]WLV80180.1 type II toxin-antitoxin system death-on-curing family toxin [Lacticaseibacillus sp. NCIMB 15473]WNX24140.1 type II toxin-antitoxin system death-on-curing family toxin [Lacticaseibacillus casei]WNX26914.1 type II toxin-antitoxin sy
MEYLTQNEIIAINAITQTAQHQQPSIRDAEALDYIVKSARQEAFGNLLYDTIEKLAAFYFVKLIKKHVFNDANKRTAYTAIFLFLERNNYRLPSSKEFQLQFAELAIAIASTDGESEALWNSVKSFFTQNISLVDSSDA